MTLYRALHVTETEDGQPVTILVQEGQANDVACYIIAGEHDCADYVLMHGTKMSERAARREVSWPTRLTYRR